MIYQDKDIPEADDVFTPEIMDDSYMNMEVALPRYTDRPDFSRVTKRLKYANGLPIGTANENPILDARVYEVEYADGHKASLTANAIAKNISAQVDDKGNRHVLFDKIIDHRCTAPALNRPTHSLSLQVATDNAEIPKNDGICSSDGRIDQQLGSH